jgi:photosystem II stability/assembly factor-like uncharacterized protein
MIEIGYSEKVMTLRFGKIVLAIFLMFAIAACSNRRDKSDTSEVTTLLSPIDSTANPPATSEKQNRASVIYRSLEGRTWTPFDNGVPPDATVSSFLVIDNTIFAATDYHGIYAVRDGDTNWNRIDKGLPSNIDINAIAVIDNMFIIGTLSHGMMSSVNKGRDWDYLTNEFDKIPVRSLHTKGSLLFAGTDKGIYLSKDKGLSWQLQYKGVQVNGFTELNGKIYAALMNGAVVTNDDGLHWNYVYKPLTLHDISNDGERLYAMTLGAGLKTSDNDGLVWEDANRGLGLSRFYTFEVKRWGNRIFAAQWHGIYVSDNFGKDWAIMRSGLPDSTAFATLEVMNTGLVAGIGLRKE